MLRQSPQAVHIRWLNQIQKAEDIGALSTSSLDLFSLLVGGRFSRYSLLFLYF